MGKVPAEQTMAWIIHALHAGGVVPDGLWSLVRWIAFLCKLASLAFAIPIIGLIVFDFCLWIWRLNRPQPRDLPQPSRASSQHRNKIPSSRLSPANGSSSTNPPISTSQRRIAYQAEMG
ncbi:hypothetical protein F5Y15DRAFT_168430 [Xylariaceae sp. FL0016]|nr:hypothetical protein F5Y15DRAFT_168430 [Xylariaceae sp. FL0016]